MKFGSNINDAFATLQLQMLGAFAEFERTMIRKQQAEGIAKARAKGVYAKRGKSIDRTKAAELKDAGKTVTQIAIPINVSRMSVYRIFDEAA